MIEPITATPEPWRAIYDARGKHWVVTGGSNITVAVCAWTSVDRLYHGGPLVAEKNARLIAVAPRMRRLLAWMMEDEATRAVYADEWTDEWAAVQRELAGDRA
jgi:hypothetical protein